MSTTSKGYVAQGKCSVNVRNYYHECVTSTPIIRPNLAGLWGYLGGASDKESTGQCRRCRFSPWVRKIPWRRAWQPTPVFLPGKSHGQRSLVGYSPQSHKESDTTEATEHTQQTCRNSLKKSRTTIVSGSP